MKQDSFSKMDFLADEIEYLDNDSTGSSEEGQSGT